LQPGTRVFAEGPYGAMTAARRRGTKVLLVAGGIGVTPLRALFESVPAAPGEVTLLYRTTGNADAVFLDELRAIAGARGATFHWLAGSRSDLGHDPLSTDVLNANIPDLRSHDVFLCGPDGMTRSVVAALRRAKVPRRQIHHESFEF
jgi:predicted ferric reductase